MFKFLKVLVLSPIIFGLQAQTTHAAGIREGILEKLGGVSKGTFQTGQTQGQPIINAISFVTNALIGILGVLAVILVIYSGFLWMTAGGNEDQVGKSKTILKQTIVGIIIVTLAYAIVAFVLSRVQGVPRTSFDVNSIPYVQLA